MLKLAWKTLAVLAMTIASLPAQEVVIDARPDLRIDQEHTQWIDHVMRSIATIKPGMTRKELARVFAEEGGLSTRTRRRYVYKHCPYIKVEIEFSPVGEPDLVDGNVTTESHADVILKISQPFLEYSIAD